MSRIAQARADKLAEVSGYYIEPLSSTLSKLGGVSQGISETIEQGPGNGDQVGLGR